MRFGASFRLDDYNNHADYATLLRSQADIYTGDIEFKDQVIWTSASTWEFTKPDAFAAVTTADGKQLRVYPAFAPGWQSGSTVTASNWEALATAHCQRVLQRYPQIVAWDVVNELFDGILPAPGYIPNIWTNAAGSGDAFFQYIFKAAEAAAPNMPLFYCDNSTEQGYGTIHDAKRSHILSAITEALKAGCRIDGFSSQCHLDPINYDYRSDRAKHRDFLLALKALGLTVNITELDVQCPSSSWTGTYYEWDRLAAETVAMVLDTFASVGVPVSHISSWGLSDSYGTPGLFRPRPFDATFQPKPMVDAIRNALLAMNNSSMGI